MVSKNTTDLNLIILGSPEAGKATTIGTLLYKIADKSSGNLQKLHQQAQDLEKNHEDPAWILDHFKDQREAGADPEEGDSTLKIITAKNQFNIAEVSGHERFIKNVISRLPALDAALLIVSAKFDEYEAYLVNQDLISQDILLAFSLGVKNFIVAVNKIDEDTQDIYEQIEATVTERIKKITNLESSQIICVPISAKHGDNITEPSENLGWHEGPTLLQAFEGIPPAKKLEEKPLRLPLQDVYKIIDKIAPMGRIESGTLKIGQEIYFAPGDVQTTVKAFETIGGGISDEAPAGWNMGFSVEEKIKFEDLKRGYVCGDAKNDPPREALSFEAFVYFTNDSEKIEKGRSIIFDCHTAHITCEVAEIKEKISKRDGSVVERNPELLGPGDAALIKFVPKKPICVEAFSDYLALGRFGMRGEKTQNIGIGLIKSVEKKPLVGAGKGNKK